MGLNEQQSIDVLSSRIASVPHEVTLGKNFDCDTFGNDVDVPPEDLYEDQFLNDLEHDRFVKIDDSVELMVNKEDNEIIFRKNGPDTDKCVGEYVMKLEEGELEQVIINIMAIKEGINNDVTLKSNDVELRVTKNSKEQFVVTLTSRGALSVSMISTTSVLLRKIIYALIYGILK